MSLMKRILGSASDIRDYAAFLKASGMSGADIGQAIRGKYSRGTYSRTLKNPNYKEQVRVDIAITGVAELDAKFRAMPNTLQKKALRPATRAVAKLTLQDAKARAPQKTGQLAKSLKVVATKASRRKDKYTVSHSVQTSDGMFQGDQYYGGFMEFGTKERYTKAGAYRGYIKRTFWYLRPALKAFPEKKLALFRDHVYAWMTTVADKHMAQHRLATEARDYAAVVKKFGG